MATTVRARATRGRWVLITAVAAIAASLALAAQPAEAATTTETRLVTSVNPASNLDTVTYTAIVTVPGQPGVVATGGQVDFTVSGLVGCSNRPVSAGVATCTSAMNGLTTRTVTAAFEGNATWAASTSAPLTQRVTADGNRFDYDPPMDQTCGTFHDLALPVVPGATQAAIYARGGTGGVSGTNTNGTPAPGQGGRANSQGISYPISGSTHLAYIVGCGGGSADPGQGSPANGGSGWGDGGSGGAATTSGPRGGGGGGGSAACLSTAPDHVCESGIPVLVAGGGGGTGPGVHYGGGGGGAGGGGTGGAKGGGCGDTPPTAGTGGSSSSGDERWYDIASKPLGAGYGGGGGGGAGCGSNKGGAGGGGGGGTGGAGGDRCCTSGSGGAAGAKNAPGGGGAGETGNGSAGAAPNASFGGNGGNGAASTNGGATGGGGGGGYTGGGGGGAGNGAGSAGGPGGGGGGGSSWVNLLGSQAGTGTGTGQPAGANGSVTLTLSGAVVYLGSLGYPNIPVGTTVNYHLPFRANDPRTPGTFSYAITATDLPPGTSMDPVTGDITGAPTAPGNYPAAYTITGTHTVNGTFTRTIVQPWVVTGTATTTTSTTSTSTSTSTSTTTTAPTTTSTSTSTTTSSTSTTTSTTAPTTTSTSTTTTTTSPCTPDLVPFATAQQLVGQLVADAGKTDPNNVMIPPLVAGVSACTVDPDALAVELVHAPQTQDDARLLRLYVAYFKRPPDPDGFAYWQRQLDAGRGLINAAKKFAESSEFKRTYGTLSNAAFIDLVYQNVLGRGADPGGKAFWLTRLDNKTKNRGDVMINFSESSENLNKKKPHVAVFRLHRAMLRKFPAKAGYDALLDPVLAGTGSLADVAHALRTSPAYAARF